VLGVILGGGMSSRLYQEIREKRGLAYSIYSYHSLYTETGLIAVYAGTRPTNAENVIKLIKNEIESIIDKGITDKELHRAKEHLKGQLILSLESTSNRMMRLGKSELTHGEILTLNELISRIEKVKREDVRDLAGKIFRPEKMVLTVIGSFRDEEFLHLMP
jgi:predicted Zn-dependent peptidase